MHLTVEKRKLLLTISGIGIHQKVQCNYKFADKIPESQQQGSLALDQTEKHKEKCLIVKNERSGLFQGQNEVCKRQAFQKRRQSLHAIIPQNDQDECQGALSTLEDSDPCFVGMVLEVWGNSCQFPWLLGTVL